MLKYEKHLSCKDVHESPKYRKRESPKKADGVGWGLSLSQLLSNCKECIRKESRRPTNKQNSNKCTGCDHQPPDTAGLLENEEGEDHGEARAAEEDGGAVAQGDPGHCLDRGKEEEGAQRTRDHDPPLDLEVP